MTGIEHDRLTSGESKPDDKVFDRAIRPKRLDEYVGQPGVKQQMGIFIEAARRRSEAWITCSYSDRPASARPRWHTS